MKILVTGCAGFVGRWLVRELAAHGHEVFGTSLAEDAVEGLATGRAFAADLSHPEEVGEVFEASQPDAVIHLAGLAHVGSSWEDPARWLEVNTVAATRVFIAAAKARVRRFLYISSSEVYGNVRPEDLPIREAAPVWPTNPYAVSKHASEEMLRLLSAEYGVCLTIARSFNHTGPGQAETFVSPGFARQVALIEAGRQDKLRHGDLTPKRDFLDVRDVAAAYRMIIENDLPGRMFNVASGRSVSIAELLTVLKSLARIPIESVQDPSLVRPVDIVELRGDSSALRTATGWTPAWKLEDTLASLLEHHRSLLKREPELLRSR